MSVTEISPFGQSLGKPRGLVPFLFNSYDQYVLCRAIWGGLESILLYLLLFHRTLYFRIVSSKFPAICLFPRGAVVAIGIIVLDLLIMIYLSFRDRGTLFDQSVKKRFDLFLLSLSYHDAPVGKKI